MVDGTQHNLICLENLLKNNLILKFRNKNIKTE